MARVIKAGAGGQKPARPATRMIVDAGDKKIMQRAVFQAKQDAEHILMRAENERQAVIADGKKQAARAREEAMTRGASEAFADAAAEALAAFRKRADRYGEAADDIRALALEVVRKVLGNEPDLGPKDVDKIMQRGMAQLRARRRLRLQVSAKRLGELAHERPNLMKALQSEPDLLIEAVDDVSDGFARVVTEIGGALCAEETALDALSVSVNVREQPRQSRQTPNATTNVGTAPSGVNAMRRASTESVPDAAIEELDDEDDTMNLSPRSRGVAATAAVRARVPSSSLRDDIEEIEAEEDDFPEENTARQPPRATNVQAGARQVQGRPVTRAVPIDSSQARGRLTPPRAGDSGDDTLRHTPRMNSNEEDGDDAGEDLDLFTDDAVKTPRKRR